MIVSALEHHLKSRLSLTHHANKTTYPLRRVAGGTKSLHKHINSEVTKVSFQKLDNFH